MQQDTDSEINFNLFELSVYFYKVRASRDGFFLFDFYFCKIPDDYYLIKSISTFDEEGVYKQYFKADGLKGLLEFMKFKLS